MTKTKIDQMVTSVINVALLIGIFAFGYWRWQLLQNVLVESNVSQTHYRSINGTLKISRQLTTWGSAYILGFLPTH